MSGAGGRVHPGDAAALRVLLEAVPVAGLSALRVRVPFRRPYATATGMWLHREAWIVLLEGADGRLGLGEAVLEPDATEVEETILARAIRETTGRAREGDLPDAEELELLGGPGRAFRAALDAARLDLAIAPDAVPVPVPVNGTIGFAAPREGAEAALQAIEAGFRTLKLKAGAERETEDLVARVRAIRQAVGPEIRLRLDVNGAWDLPTAEDRLEAVARFDVEYVEQPLAADDTAGAAELRRRVGVPVAADEAVYSPAGARSVLAAEAADVLVVKPARVGGPVAVAEIAAAAQARGVPVVLSTLFETGIGVAAARAAAAALPAIRWRGAANALPHGLATAGLLEHDLLRAPLIVEDGRLAAPGGEGTAGLGIALDDGVLRRFAVEAVEAAG
ncbi:MAG: mandelate racemase/muconate lactonizing enzyme family protein [Chloroflexi bacterium]|nr:mandelate racemase/muconate lactonizing enzyme family protein [Chloroflexota bacterium]